MTLFVKLSERKKLKDLDFDLDLTGFNSDELDRYLAGIDATPGLTDEDAAPEPPETPVSRTGDLWMLGNHRVLCGDATQPADIERLMQAERADLVFTDPPYNVDYTGYTKQKLTLKGDRMPAEEFRRFLRKSFDNYRTVIKPGASLYVCHASSVQRDFQDAIESAGFEVRCQIIWAKNTHSHGASAGTSSSTNQSITATLQARATPGTATNRNRRCGSRRSPRRIASTRP